MLMVGLPELRDRRGGGGQGDLHPAVPACHGPQLEGHGLRRLEVSDRGAQACPDRYEGRNAPGALHHSRDTGQDNLEQGFDGKFKNVDTTTNYLRTGPGEC